MFGLVDISLICGEMLEWMGHLDDWKSESAYSIFGLDSIKNNSKSN